MLVNLNEVLKYAKEHHCAIGSFNTPTLESLNAVLNAATKLNVPVIIMHAVCNENEAPLTIIVAIVFILIMENILNILNKQLNLDLVV